MRNGFRSIKELISFKDATYEGKKITIVYKNQAGWINIAIQTKTGMVLDWVRPEEITKRRV